MARTDLGYRPTFDINNLRQLGYFVDPVTGYRYGGAPLLLNRQNYARNEFRVQHAARCSTSARPRTTCAAASCTRTPKRT